MKRLCVLLLGLLSFASGVSAQNQEVVYKVLVGEATAMAEEPFPEVYEGFEVDLWKEVAYRLDLKYEFVRAENFSSLLYNLENHQADFALAGISVRHDRLDKMDFSHPYYHTSVRALLRQNSIGVWTSVRTLMSPLVLKTVGVYLVFCVFFGAVFWLLERKHENDIRHHMFPGIFDGVWYAFKKSWGVKSHSARVLVLPLWIITLLFSSLITAQVISNFSASESKYLLNRTTDLSTISHAAIAGTSSAIGAEAIAEQFESFREVENSEALYQLFANGEVDSIAADGPMINDLYARAKDDGVAATIHPRKFSQEYYAIAISKQVPEALKQQIDETIIALRDERFLLALEERWMESRIDAPKMPKVKLQK